MTVRASVGSRYPSDRLYAVRFRDDDYRLPVPGVKGVGGQPGLGFGQARCDDALTVHFLCMLLRMSRYLGVCAQDHKFDSEEACVAIYRFMCKVGGRVEELVIDQDSVFVGSEVHGEVFATETFDAFLKEQDIKIWCCNKHDPESKGAVESLCASAHRLSYGSSDAKRRAAA